jgi:hypothetical protein
MSKINLDLTHTQEKIMSENKSGFEIRAELLSQAQCIVEQNRNMAVDKYHQDVCRAQDAKDIPYPEFPILKPMTAEDVIAVAVKLNEFVNQK